MPWLALNGHEIDIRQTEPKAASVPIGRYDKRAYSGALRRTNRGYKREFSDLMTPHVSQQEARALEGLLDGTGHSWSFADASDYLYSSKGRNKASGSATRTASGGKFGAYITIGAGSTVTWDLDFGSEWTLMVWYYTGAAWKHYILDSAGNEYENGVAVAGGTITWLALSSGTATLGDSGAGAGQDFDDFVALPYVIPATWASSFGTATSAFSALPVLTLTGDCIEESSMSVMGINPVSRWRPAVVGGSFDDTAQIVSFSLTEI